MDSSSDEEWETNETKAQKLYKSAKDIARKSKESKEQLKKCYELLVKANKLFPCEKYQTRINQVKEQLEERDDQSDSDDEVFNFGTVEKAVKKVSKNEKLDKNKTEVAPGLIISNEVFDKLYPYQKEGVKMLYKWFAERKGGILADDMGLGKTIQTIVLLSALFDSDVIKHVLIIAPISLLQNWHDEFAKWAPNVQIYTYHGNNKLIQLQFVQRRGGVLLTTYDTARINFQYLNSKGASTFVWDYVILDEAHKIKNPTKTTRSLHEIPARVRLCITGTPVQNNLRELWVLYDFSMNGTLLGTYPTFKANYQTPITKGREKDANDRVKRLGKELALQLNQIYKPYFLRRTKNEVFTRLSLNNSLNNSLTSQVSLPTKTDWVVWIKLSSDQIKSYKNFLETDEVQNVVMGIEKKSRALLRLNILKKICDHPRLLSSAAIYALLESSNSNLNEEQIEEMGNFQLMMENFSDEQFIKESGKLMFLVELLDDLKKDGHKMLVFSRSLKILDIINRILINKNWKVARLDGRIKMKDRDTVVRTFQTDKSYSICLLTSQVGGVGLTLTAADRVIIYDPSWNPGADNQAVDRVYRIGQKLPVIVYRLITCGGVEEKIYRRQVFKNSLINQTVGQKEDPIRYFTNSELVELFKMDDPNVSETYKQLQEKHGHQEKLSPHDINHRDQIRSFKKCYNVSDNSLLFSYEVNEDVNDDNDENLTKYVQEQVQIGRNKLIQESQLVELHLSSTKQYTRPFTLHVSSEIKQNQVKKDQPAIPYPVYDLDDSIQVPKRKPFNYSPTLDDSILEENDYIKIKNDVDNHKNDLKHISGDNDSIQSYKINASQGSDNIYKSIQEDKDDDSKENYDANDSDVNLYQKRPKNNRFLSDDSIMEDEEPIKINDFVANSKNDINNQSGNDNSIQSYKDNLSHSYAPIDDDDDDDDDDKDLNEKFDMEDDDSIKINDLGDNSKNNNNQSGNDNSIQNYKDNPSHHINYDMYTPIDDDDDDKDLNEKFDVEDDDSIKTNDLSDNSKNGMEYQSENDDSVQSKIINDSHLNQHDMDSQNEDDEVFDDSNDKFDAINSEKENDSIYISENKNSSQSSKVGMETVINDDSSIATIKTNHLPNKSSHHLYSPIDDDETVGSKVVHNHSKSFSPIRDDHSYRISEDDDSAHNCDNTVIDDDDSVNVTEIDDSVKKQLQSCNTIDLDESFNNFGISDIASNESATVQKNHRTQNFQNTQTITLNDTSKSHAGNNQTLKSICNQSSFVGKPQNHVEMSMSVDDLDQTDIINNEDQSQSENQTESDQEIQDEDSEVDTEDEYRDAAREAQEIYYETDEGSDQMDEDEEDEDEDEEMDEQDYDDGIKEALNFDDEMDSDDLFTEDEDEKEKENANISTEDFYGRFKRDLQNRKNAHSSILVPSSSLYNRKK